MDSKRSEMSLRFIRLHREDLGAGDGGMGEDSLFELGDWADGVVAPVESPCDEDTCLGGEGSVDELLLACE